VSDSKKVAPDVTPVNASADRPAPTRRKRAEQTRLRIVQAAHELFVARGYSGATMADIAQAAGVAVQTVYFVFHTKSELLQACYEVAVLGADDPKPPPMQPWWSALMRAKTPAAAARHFAAGTTSIVARAGALDDIVRAARHEPDAIRVHEYSERLRRDGHRELVTHLARTFGLARGLSVDRATDVLLMLGSPSTYRSLVIEAGWSEREFVTWLAKAVQRQVLGLSGRS
jgi:AcrR family transcriptional regulator